MALAFFAERRPHRGLTYTEYMEVLSQRALLSEEGRTEEERERIRYTKLNLRRSLRIGKTYDPGENLEETARGISEEQLWMVLTEPWCGDSAQCIPYIAKIAACLPRGEMRILLRDENPDIMDRYLTDGKRAIPMLIAFDPAGREVFRWGPRPEGAAEVFQREKESGAEKPQIQERLHLWYARDRGQSIEREFLQILRRL